MVYFSDSEIQKKGHKYNWNIKSVICNHCKKVNDNIEINICKKCVLDYVKFKLTMSMYL